MHNIKVSYQFLFLALMLWAISLYDLNLKITDLGIFESFSIIYYLSIAALLISIAIVWLTNSFNKLLSLFQFFLIFIIVIVIPQVIGGSQPASSSFYGYFSNIQYIIDYHSLSPDKEYYHNWPGSPILTSIIILITGINEARLLIQHSPEICIALLLLPVAAFLRVLSNNQNYVYAGLLVFILANFLGQITMVPQTLGYGLILIINIIVMKVILQKHRFCFGYKLNLIMIFFVLSFTHLLSACSGLLSFGLLSLQKKSKYFLLVTLFAILVVSWTIYAASSWFDSNFKNLISMAFSFDKVISDGVIDPIGTGSKGHKIVSIVRIILAVIFIILTFIGIIVDCRVNKHQIKRNIWLVLYFGTLCFIPLFSLGGYIAHEIFVRSFIFVLPLISFYTSKMLHSKYLTILLIVFFIFIIPLRIIALYGNQKIDYYSPSQFAAVNFYKYYGHEESSVTDIYPINEARREIVNVPLEKIYFNDNQIIINSDIRLSNHYLGVFNNKINYFEYYLNDHDFIKKLYEKIQGANNSNLVYNNNKNNIFYVRRF